MIYSLAAPKRQDPKTGDIYQSCQKTTGEALTSKSLNLSTQDVETVSIEPANQQEIDGTTKVMGGEDWQLWIEALKADGLLSNHAKTIAYSYIGPDLTHAIYRNGTIGQAKKHLEKTASSLNELLLSLIHI